ncbi:hypothetical protein ABKN59_010519 [Abortiporus biennis]
MPISLLFWDSLLLNFSLVLILCLGMWFFMEVATTFLEIAITFALLIRDGTLYLCVTFVLNILDACVVSTSPKTPDIEVLIGPGTWLCPILISRTHSSRFSSMHFVGNVGAPLNITSSYDYEGEDGIPCDTPFVSARQVLENPLSIGLLDETYTNMERENVSGLAGQEDSEIILIEA